MTSKMVAVDRLKTTVVPSDELVESIRRCGVLNPVVLYKSGRKIFDGKSRVAACKILGIKEIPAITINLEAP